MTVDEDYIIKEVLAKDEEIKSLKNELTAEKKVNQLCEIQINQLKDTLAKIEEFINILHYDSREVFVRNKLKEILKSDI